MTADDLLDALALPPSARVDRRVPKTLLTEHAPTAPLRRLIQAGVERLQWTHALKPTTAGVPAYHDDEREVLEVAVLHLTTRPDTNPARLIETVHRAIPYPVVLVTEPLEEEGAHLSLVRKRTARDGTGRAVLDGDLVQTPEAPAGCASGAEIERAFLDALPLAEQPQSSLDAVYRAWMDTITALNASRLLGSYRLPSSSEHADARRVALAEVARLDAEIATLRRSATREKQVARRADLNLRLARLRADRQAALDAL